jgi:hypothetical protein
VESHDATSNKSSLEGENPIDEIASPGGAFSWYISAGFAIPDADQAKPFNIQQSALPETILIDPLNSRVFDVLGADDYGFGAPTAVTTI